MKFTTGRLSLLRELSFLQGITEKKTTIPILASLHFSAGARAGGLTIHGTDLDSHLTTFLDATIVEPGECCIPAKKLTEIVKALPEAEITFTVEGESIRITCERSKFKLTGHIPSNFPAAKVTPETMLPFPADTLKTLFSRVRFAASDAESRFTMNGVKLEYADGKSRAIATDGHRLAFCERSTYYEGEKIDALIPAKTVDTVIKLIDSNEPVLFGLEDGTLFFSFGKRTLTTRTLVGQFPDYSKIFPKPLGTITADGLRLKAALNRIALVTDDRSRACKIDLRDNLLTAIAATAEIGEGQAEMEVEMSEHLPPMTLGLNVTYVADYFAHAPEGAVRIAVTDAQSQIMMSPVEDGDFDYRYVVMPMRI